jgi:hypothetical protein
MFFFRENFKDFAFLFAKMAYENKYYTFHKMFLNFSYKPQSKQSARLSIQSSELGTRTPSPPRECCSPSFWIKGGDTLVRGGGLRGWGPYSDDRTDTLVLQVYYYPSTLQAVDFLRNIGENIGISIMVSKFFLLQ